MRKKLSLITMTLILIFSFFCGCLDSDTPTDQPIILDASSPTRDVDLRSDCDTVQWFIDDNFVREDAVPESGGPIYFTLERNNYGIGDHILKAVDRDSEIVWTFTVKDHGSAAPQQVAAAAPVNAERGYDQSTPWEERHVKAKAYWDSVGRNA